MKCLSAVVCIMTCAVGCAAVRAAQEATAADKAPSAASETKSLVQGKVVQEPGGQGIRKVRVILRAASNQGQEQFEATTDEKGEFKIQRLEPGIYFVAQLERSGYVADGKANRDKTSIKVVAGQDTKDVVLRMVVAGTLTGKIVDAEGDPLRDVAVAALSTRGTHRGSQTNSNGTTNDLGEYRIADLPPGKYIVQAIPLRSEAPPPNENEKDGTGRVVYITTYYPGTLDQRQSVAVEVFAGGTASANFGLLTGRRYRVSGTVRGLTSQLTSPGKSSENLAELMGKGIGQLALIGNNGHNEQQNLGEDGKFEFQNLMPGTYRAQVIVFDFSNGQPSVKMQSISTPIEVNGTDIVGLQLQADRGGDVSGRFHGDGDEKVDWKSLYVVLLQVPEPVQENDIMPIGESGVTQLSGDGSFEIKDAPAGNYQLAVGAHSDKFRDYYTKSVLLGGREVADTGFQVSSSTVLDVVVSAKGAGIEGSVVDEKGKPVPGATVVTVPSSGKLGRPDAYQTGVSDENGHVLLRGLNPGAFIVLAFEEMQENVRSPEFAHKYEEKGEKVELQEGGSKSVVLKVIKEDLEP